jgi:tRNA 5-methylaminomethyl-2-thiouridine biosynthesis bifunctional protein
VTDDTRIDKATLDWGARDNERPAPRSVVFDDIYFSEDGLAETAHVFLAANDLPQRFEPAQSFAIGELGFGTGLNFLAVWDLWRRAKKPAAARLHFVSVEAFPLEREDLCKAHRAWPALTDLSQQLIAAYPPPHRGFHQLTFDDGITLTLYLGDALEGLACAEAQIDAWFFDGFAPDRNPAMWSPEIFSEVARLSAPGATFGTFTVAGAVRRALTSAGFAPEKRPGFGRKREMLAGGLKQPSDTTEIRAAWFNTRPATPLNTTARIAIIGAGIAGASLAYALNNLGLAPVVYEAEAPASGASGNPAGLIMPRLDVDTTPTAHYFAHAYLHTIRLLNKLQQDAPAPLFSACGVRLCAAYDHDKARHEKRLAMAALPDGWIEAAGEDLHFPQAGVVDPAAFVRALLGATPLRQAKIIRLDKQNGKWRTEDSDGNHDIFDVVIIANGLDALSFTQVSALPLAGALGQIDWFPEAPEPTGATAFGPYIAPAPQGGLVIGATYAPIAIGRSPEFSQEATQTNIAAVRAKFPELGEALSPERARPRASIRCTTPDRSPIAGPVPDWAFYAAAYDGLRHGLTTPYKDGQSQDGLYILTGLGSRGLVSAPLAAAMIAAEIAGAPAPVEAGVAEALHPARFFIRELKKAKPQ